jgi:hypothetical protein
MNSRTYLPIRKLANSAPEYTANSSAKTRRELTNVHIGGMTTVHESLNSSSSPLEPKTKKLMESRFGQDFSRIRIHSDSLAAESAKSLNAHAYTVGQHLVFGHGKYAPDTLSGLSLIAHELTHATQQGTICDVGDTFTSYGIDSDGSASEREANFVMNEFWLGHFIRPTIRSAICIQRQTLHRTRVSPTIRRGLSLNEYLNLLEQADATLRRAGWDAERTLHALAGIYYGAEWSREMSEEHDSERNRLFGAFVDRSWTASDDPRPLLGEALFMVLRNNQDIEGIDMGHILIGMDARMRSQPRQRGTVVDLAPGVNLGLSVLSWITRLGTRSSVNSDTPQVFRYPTRAAGAELVTWVGDLGGAAARIATDRYRAYRAGRSTPPNVVSSRFEGTDYGTESNLRGDILGLTIGATRTQSSEIAGVVTNEGLANAIRTAAHGSLGVAARQILEMNSGRIAYRHLVNRAEVVHTIAGRIKDFARAYLNSPHAAGPFEAPAVAPFLSDASLDVAERFVSWLESQVNNEPPNWIERMPPHLVRGLESFTTGQ